jgi:hypothetical protein
MNKFCAWVRRLSQPWNMIMCCIIGLVVLTVITSFASALISGILYIMLWLATNGPAVTPYIRYGMDHNFFLFGLIPFLLYLIYMIGNVFVDGDDPVPSMPTIQSMMENPPTGGSDVLPPPK